MRAVTTIPTIDPTAPDAAARLVDAYATYGFAHLVHHAVPDELLAAVFAASRAFHASPRDQKDTIALDARHRGYIAIDTSTTRHSPLAVVTKPNQSESFIALREDAPDSVDVHAGTYLAGPNQWPGWLPEFRPVLEAYQATMTGLGLRLVGLVEEGLGCERGTLARHFSPPTTWLRLLHYPPRPADAPDDLYGSAPHLDFGFLTLLAQDGTGGLEVQTPEGEWAAVPPVPGALVMNVGEMLHRWSNGRLRATPHRVHNRSAGDRLSVPFFFDPHVRTVISPLPECVQDGEEPRFQPVQFGDFLRDRLEGSYLQHQGRGGG